MQTHDASSAFVFVFSSHQLRVALQHSVFATRTARLERMGCQIVPTTCLRPTSIYAYNRDTRELSGPYHATNFAQYDLLPLPVCGRKNRAHVPIVRGAQVFTVPVHVPMICGAASQSHIDELFAAVAASRRLPEIARGGAVPAWLQRSKTVMDFWDETVATTAAAPLPPIASR